jgi:catechol 2,3-dioxygenase-like lactoylglutathione lyase family enzyme
MDGRVATGARDRADVIPAGHPSGSASVFSHVFTSVTDFDRAFAFYDAVLGALDLRLRFHDRDMPWAGWHGVDAERPLFVICRPFDGRPHDPGNGQMVAFLAADRATVRTVYRIALEHGGRGDGEPGLRPAYHADYYGAYFRDPDGNKLCVASHGPE